MPNDATHRIINYLMLSWFIVLNFYISFEHDFRLIMIFIGSYILGTEVFSPDLDTYSKPSQRLGILSFPIRKFSKHRGLGHNIFIGWLLKASYLTLIYGTILSIILLVACKFGYDACKFGYDTYWIIDHIDIKVIGALLTGLFLSNAVHIITDKIL